MGLVWAIRKLKSSGSAVIDQWSSLVGDLVERLYEAAGPEIAIREENMGFHPIKVFHSLQKHGYNADLPSLFQHWPASDQNALVLPVCLYSCLQYDDSAYNSGEFIRIARAQWNQQHHGIPIMFGAFLLSSNATEIKYAMRRLVQEGDDLNVVARTKLLKGFFSEWTRRYPYDQFGLIEELTPLSIAVTFADLKLVRQLIELGANPCLV